MDIDENQNLRPPPPCFSSGGEPPITAAFFFESKPELGNGDGGGGEGLVSAPQPLESLYGTPIPPFLSKTFDLVDDASLDAIIDCGARGDSFVVWNPMEFGSLRGSFCPDFLKQ